VRQRTRLLAVRTADLAEREEPAPVEEERDEVARRHLAGEGLDLAAQLRRASLPRGDRMSVGRPDATSAAKRE
jgi:hypothetical protein